MTTSLHSLVGPAKVQGEIAFLGQNILLPEAERGMPRFAAVVYAVRGTGAEAPAVALLLKLTFSKPMMPLICPGHRLWDQLVKPHLQSLKSALLKHEASGHAPCLGGVMTEAASLVRREAQLLQKGGGLLLPQERILLQAAEELETMPQTKRQTAWPVRLYFSRAA